MTTPHRAALTPADLVSIEEAALRVPLESVTRAAGTCAYFLLLGDEIVYVGSTTNIARRLYDHEREMRGLRRCRGPRKVFDATMVIPMPSIEHARGFEHAAYLRLSPRFNREWPKALPRYVDAWVARLEAGGV